MPRNSSHSADHSSHTASDRDANFEQQTFACSAGNCLMALQQTQLLCSKPVLLALQQTCTACFAANLCAMKGCAQKKQVNKSKPATFAVIELPQDGACKLVATRIVVLCSNDTCTTAESQHCFFLHTISTWLYVLSVKSNHCPNCSTSSRREFGATLVKRS